LVIPPLQGKKITVGAATFNFASSVGAAPCLQFDSMMMVEFKFSGQVVCWGTGSAINFGPRGLVPVDKMKTITSCRMSFVAVVCQYSHSACVQFVITDASIIGNHFEFVEINGASSPGTKAGAPQGITIVGATSTTSFQSNIMDIIDIHMITSAGVQIGVNQANQMSYRSNIWRIGAIRPSGPSASGFNSFGSYDVVQIGGINQEEGHCEFGIYLEPGSTGNRICGSGMLVSKPWVDHGIRNVLC